ncbi:hypothetical protein BO78DRAFT_330333 [Aspergillus sclerotiicarbonarius CBS 121057]|uniref:Uncharacterized protein n=1 Tax=Aspergillus sclerotiicarbonarius (strain CBS 121057 / IBT 28362) TaxID=1448318 RepID=A0A319DRW1_ASPSB|nr:hypothetical protein BO78DRAFT_330333 [Aspergillus sclerotiicarbonarius CBS 121057]
METSSPPPAGVNTEESPSGDSQHIVETSSSTPVDANPPGFPSETGLYPNQRYLCQREEYRAMIQHHYTRYNTHSPGVASPDNVKMQSSLLWTQVYNWAEVWGDDAAPLPRLSAADKREIIATLDGYCVQEDWDRIRLHLPPTARASMGKILLEAMINQFICVKFIDNPFWFMDAKINATDRDGDANFHKRFQYIYERLKAIEPMDAAWWKTLLVQRCNERGSLITQPPPTKLSQDTAAHRTARLKAYGDELLERRGFRLLLKDEQDKTQRAQRDEGLRNLLEFAAQQILHADGGLYANLVVDRLRDLPPTFKHGSDSMTSHLLHAEAEPADGGRILIVTHPGITVTDRQSISHWNGLDPWRVTVAEVVVAGQSKP